jgi:ATP-dependent DNA helicase RecQ
MTLTLEAYYQEAGRAGRDGNPSQCIILYEPDDRKLMEFFLKTSYPDVNHIEKIYNAILDLSQVQTGTKGSNFLTIDNMQLANRMNLPYMLVDSVISFLERNYIIAKNYGASNATVLFTMTQERISEYFKNTTDERRNVLEAILRCTSYQAFNKPTLINLNELNYKYDIDLESLKRCIDDFEFAGVMKLSLENGEGDYKLLIERMPLIKLPIDFDNFKFRKELAVKKLDIMQRYIETRQCKRNYILEYFKETDLSGICNRCSSCQKQEKVISKISEKEKYLYIQILKAVAQLNGRYGKTILTDILKGNPTLKIRANNLNKLSCYSSCSEFTTEQILNALWKAVKEGLINITADKYPTVYITDSGRKFLGTENIIEFQTTTSSQFHPELFEKLLKLRNELARRYSVHPEIIILNTSIRKMAELLPATEQELKEISGIGKVFINRYSNAFLHLINHYINESSGIKKRTEDLPELVQHTMQLFNESESLDTVAKKMKITQAQAASYLQQGIESGMKIRLDKIKNNKLFEKVCHLVLKSPEAPLRVIRTQIQSEINYPELRVMVAVARIEAKK